MRPTPSRVAPVALLTAVALTGASPALAESTRPADNQAPMITAITVNPSPVVLGTKAAGRTAFAVAVRATDPGGGVDRVTVGLYDPADSSGRAFRLSRTSGSAVDGLWTGTLVLSNRAKRGAWSLRAFATDSASNTTDPDKVYTNFRVTLPTRLRAFDVKSDPATGAVNATALLERFRPGTQARWVPFARRTVTLEFQPNGTNSFFTLATGKTTADGSVRFEKVSANQSGTWRVNYAGNSGYAADVSGSRLVTVTAPASTSTAPASATPTTSEASAAGAGPGSTPPAA
ncbi:MAG TPA: hypothetical protein VMZ00_01025 [Sporichthya sp.]|nr:hypothetical protein [Sporichthya sp.]